VDTQGGASVPAAFTENSVEQVGSAVEYLGMLAKARSAMHVTLDPDDLPHSVEIASRNL